VRVKASASCLSWIPPEAVEGTFELPFGLRIAHYDAPPPDATPDVDALLSSDSIRFANQLHGWIEVEDGRIIDHGTSGGGQLGSTRLHVGPFGVTFAAIPLPDLNEPPAIHADHIRFTQTAGGHTGVAVPRRIRHAPFWRIAAPIAWSTLTLTIATDGSATAGLPGASPFPRHYLYDPSGRLIKKTGLIRYKTWLRESAEHDTPWAGVDNPVPLAGVSSKAERSVADRALVSRAWTQHGLPAGNLLSERPISESQVHLLLDGILVIELDQQPVSEVGPGAIFDPSKRAPESKRRVTVRARTPCRLAVITRAALDDQALAAVADEQMSRLKAVLTHLPNTHP
jgi:hypothetical protein